MTIAERLYSLANWLDDCLDSEDYDRQAAAESAAVQLREIAALTAGTAMPGQNAAPVPVEIVSFGYGHGSPPVAHITVDVRAHFRDPHADPARRDLTAEHPKVIEAVMGTPGVARLVTAIAASIRAFRAGPASRPVTVAVGCVGGRHRSAAIADQVARLLKWEGIPVTVTHRDMGRPVIERRAESVS